MTGFSIGSTTVAPRVDLSEVLSSVIVVRASPISTVFEWAQIDQWTREVLSTPLVNCNKIDKRRRQAWPFARPMTFRSDRGMAQRHFV
jgi:hypothetical protein